MIFSFTFGLFLIGKSIGWRFEYNGDWWFGSLNIQVGIIGVTVGWQKPLPPISD